MRGRTIRARLTAIYGGLFFLAGAVLMALTYLLVWQILNRSMPKMPDPQALQTMLARLKITFGGNQEQVDTLYNVIRDAQEQQRSDVLNGLLVQGAVALVGVGAVAVALGWLLAGRALRPVHQVTETAKRIAGSGRGLHERIDLGGQRNEMTELATTFNAMLERLDNSFDGQTRFIANASHEMRTPLAVKRALIEVTISRPDTSTDAKRLGESLLEVNARHERLIDGLLTLADSENELTEHSEVDLADIAENVLDQLAGPARDAGVEVRAATLGPSPVVGDPVLLERLTQNLVENAIRHNRPSGWLSVRTGLGTLTVSNTGPVVRVYEVETLFQPFRRLDRERVAGERGFGLGLSIARAVSRAHGGDITAVPRPDGGLEVTVTLPSG
ncbi:sensor histidine kinase [Actinocrispum wychmicini]|uniref:histidine kinase n=1 Tax=Actinocrispum wychmicini TaxID=1213861 RepID=A0A4R2JBQ7_9PSEU|nr:HAMP domain-containing sensor histidine kinase [Actinocrispum wychmicini]TCO56931.1 signal transduction histidine kinase [Actinocrispum wychmicini]